MYKLTVGFDNSISVQEAQEYSRLAEQVGLNRFWLSEIYHRRSSTLLAANLSSSTKKIDIGLCVLSPYSRHPALLAMEAATLDEMLGGRLVLGLGASKSFMTRHGINMKTAKPAQAIRECVTIIRSMLSGQVTAHSGEVYNIPAPGITLGFKPPRRSIPIYIGAAGPVLLQVTGEVADGVILPVMTSPKFVEYAMTRIKNGVKLAGRQLDQIDLASIIIFSVARDQRTAYDAVRGTVGWYVSRVEPIVTEIAGISQSEVDSIKSTLRTDSAAKITDLVTDELVEKASISGTPERCAEKLRELIDAGLNDLIAYQVIGPDRPWSIKSIATDVSPILEKMLRR